MFLRIYVCTTHFAFTPLDDSTHLRCYCTSSAVLFYTTVRFYASTFLRPTLLLHHCTIYASTMLLYADYQFCFIPLYVYTHLSFYDFLCSYTTGRFYPSTFYILRQLYVSTYVFWTSASSLDVTWVNKRLCWLYCILSTMLLYADCQFYFTPLYVSKHLRGSLNIVTAYWTETQGKTDTA